MSKALLLFLSLLFIPPAFAQTYQADQPGLTAARDFYMSALLRPHDYAPGKNSFLLRDLHRGQRATVLDIQGSGSVRHLWSTWSIPGVDSDVPEPKRILLRVFVDGEQTPSIEGTVDELCRAAEAAGNRYIPLPAFVYKGAFNIYLPINFAKGIRIEVEALGDVAEFYTQIDYRLGPSRAPQPRLISENAGGALRLKYTGGNVPAFGSARSLAKLRLQTQDIAIGTKSGEVAIPGPGVLRELSFQGEDLQDLELEIYWDGESAPSVKAPLRYLFADFINAAMESKPRRMTCYFPMPFRRSARIVLRSLSGRSASVRVTYGIEPRKIAEPMSYFHAQYAESKGTVGYSQFSALNIQGDGLFVGMNLFDSGHNHGGGDAALLDAASRDPHVLHGICGEDYFSFAWHKTGTMTLLTGAPEHARRYRLHLENPYPFHESFQFLFGMFAGLQPKSVAFWYQKKAVDRTEDLVAPDIPWKALGPLGEATAVASGLSAEKYSTTVPLAVPMQVEERWQDVAMHAGFLDLTYQFRHYVLTYKGTGFIPGTSHTEVATFVDSPAERILDAVIGHDDAVTIRANGVVVASFDGRSGFGASGVPIPLHEGKNLLTVDLSNEENTDWRWSGMSLALKKNQAEGLQFSADADQALSLAIH